MKKCVGILLVLTVLFASCATPKAQYQTAEGKRKLKYYNALQYGDKKADTMKRP